mgnify:CR=1 FL=1
MSWPAFVIAQVGAWFMVLFFNSILGAMRAL